MGITAGFTVGCIGVLTAGATIMELPTTKVLATTVLCANFKLRAEQEWRHGDGDKRWGYCLVAPRS